MPSLQTAQASQKHIAPIAKVAKAQAPARANINIVIPCYNEAERLNGAAFLHFLKINKEINFTFVNDGSEDNTLHMLNTLRDANPQQIHVISLAQNSGKAEAVRQGMNYATANGFPLVGYWDADLATPLSAINDLASVAIRYQELEVVFGSRVSMLGHRIDRTLKRRIISRINSTLARLATRLPVRDTQCGAKIFRNTHNLRAAIAAEFTAEWLFDVELFSRLSARMHAPRKSFYEFPLAEWDEVAGSKVDTKVILKSGIKMLSLLADTYFGQKKPIRVVQPARNAIAGLN